MPPVGKNPNMSRPGNLNGRWAGGVSSDYRRRIKKAKPGEIVHHRNKNKKDNTRSNLTKLPSIGVHNKAHPEKGKK